MLLFCCSNEHTNFNICTYSAHIHGHFQQVGVEQGTPMQHSWCWANEKLSTLANQNVHCCFLFQNAPQALYFRGVVARNPRLTEAPKGGG